MSSSAAPNRYNGTLFGTPPPPVDSASVTTEHTVTNPPVNGRVTKEFLIKFEFLQQTDSKPVPIMLHHRQLMCSILNAYKNQIVLYDNHDQPIDQTRINKIQSNADHRALFDIYTKDGVSIKHKNGKVTTRLPRHTIIMMVKTAFSLNDIRNTDVVMRQLRGFNTFMRLHHFDQKCHDIASCGWFRELHPTQMSHEVIKAHIDASIKAATGPDTVIPQYNLAFCNPNFEEEDERPMKTKALEIQVERKLNRTMDRLLKKAFLTNPIYVPWRARHGDAAWYRQSLRAQFKYLYTTWTLPVSGVNRYEMFHLEPEILKTGFVTSCQPCRSTDMTGRWNLLIHRDNLFKATAAVQAVIDNYASIFPVTSEVAKWSYPRLVGSGTKSSPTDKSSEGDNSYAAASITSLNSILTVEDNLVPVTTTNTSFDLSAMEVNPATVNYIPPTNPVRSYADLVNGHYAYATPTPASAVQNVIPTGPSAAELRLTAQVEALTASLTEMTDKLNSFMNAPPTSSTQLALIPPTPAAAPLTPSTTTPSTITTESLLQMQQDHQTKTDATLQQILRALNLIPQDVKTEDAETTKKMAAASSPPHQSAQKKQDSKDTPNRPVSDVELILP